MPASRGKNRSVRNAEGYTLESEGSGSKIGCGAKERVENKRAGFIDRVNKNGLRKPGYENRVRKNKMLNQVQTNLWAYSENMGPLTDNVVLRAFSGFFVPKRRAVSNGRSRTGALRDD